VTSIGLKGTRERGTEWIYLWGRRKVFFLLFFLFLFLLLLLLLLFFFYFFFFFFYFYFFLCCWIVISLPVSRACLHMRRIYGVGRWIDEGTMSLIELGTA
jgi:hypothetical protein